MWRPRRRCRLLNRGGSFSICFHHCCGPFRHVGRLVRFFPGVRRLCSLCEGPSCKTWFHHPTKVKEGVQEVIPGECQGRDRNRHLPCWDFTATSLCSHQAVTARLPVDNCPLALNVVPCIVTSVRSS